MSKHIIDIVLDEDEEKVVKFLAKMDGLTVKQELRQLLALQVWEELQIHAEEAGANK